MPREEKSARLLFDQALALGESERAAFLERACGDDPRLRREVESLLAALAQADSFLETPWMPARSAEALIGTTIGQFRVEELHATGGMGAVFRASQERPRRHVALKVLRGDAVDERALRRFEDEAEMLGRLQHRNIAQVYEAGVADAPFGRVPYLAMEFVDGVSLMEHVQQQGLGVRRRVQLMIDVCDAVHHAHQKGIIHRDLKPGNILVDATGEAKVLDFGVARATEQAPDLTRYTGTHQLIGTLAYMSPEQVRGQNRDLDTRSDVYSLGLIAYELLTGQRPYDLRELSLVAAADRIEHSEPRRPRELDRSLPTDLDAVVLQALRKERERRYQSAAGFAEDLRRVLVQQPVLARPPTATYQLRKFCVRHKGLVVGAALALAALATGATVSTVAWVQTLQSREKERQALGVARNEAELSGEINRILTDMLVAPHPFRQDTLTRDARIVDVLDDAARAVEEAVRPEVAEEVHRLLGETYRELGAVLRAVEQSRRSYDLARQLYSERDPITLEATENLAMSLYDLGELDEGEALQRQVLRSTREELGPFHRGTAQSINNLALFLLDRQEYAETETLLREALEIDRRDETRNPVSLSLTLTNLANCLRALERHQEALPYAEEALALRQTLFPEHHPRIVATQNILGTLLVHLGRIEEGEAIFRRALTAARETLGEEDLRTGILKLNFSQLLTLQGRLGEAEGLLGEIVAMPVRGLGPNRRLRAAALNLRRHVIEDRGPVQDVEAAIVEAFWGCVELAPDDPERVTAEDRVRQLLRDRRQLRAGVPLVELVQEHYGERPRYPASHWTRVIARADQLPEVVGLYRELVELTRESFPRRDSTPALLLHHLAQCLVADDQLEEAEESLLEAYERFRDTIGPRDERTLQVMEDLVWLYEALRLEDDAAEFRDLLLVAREGRD